VTRLVDPGHSGSFERASSGGATGILRGYGIVSVAVAAADVGLSVLAPLALPVPAT